MASAPPVTDVLLCQRFLPEFGGSIRWMHEVYRRWPGTVEVVTHDYYNHPPRTPEFPTAPVRPAGGDHVTDANLKMDRRNIFMTNWGLKHPNRVLRYLRMTGAVRERLARHSKGVVRVHAIHAVPEVASLVPLKQMYGKRLRIISYVHGEEVTGCAASRQLTILMKQAHRVVDVMIANSRYTAQVVSPYIEKEKVHVVNPGVNLEEFQDAARMGRKLREQWGWQDRLLVLTLGRLDPRKNQMMVVEAVAKLARKHPNLLYVIAGEGRTRLALEGQVQALNLRERVLFMGNVDGELRKGLYGACDVFCMPAIRDGTDVEGFGMVFVEAAACGKPTIAGKEGGQAEAVKHEETGLVVDGTKQAEITRALERLIGDPTLRERMGRAGRDHAGELDWPKVVERVRNLVENIQ